MKIKLLMRKISFAIPAKIITTTIAVMTILGLIVCISLSNLTNMFIEKQIQYLAKINANIASEYLEAIKNQSKSLASEISKYKTLDNPDAKKMIKESLLSVLDDSRIFSSYVAFEPNAYFSNTPDGLSYYAYRDGGKINFDIYNDYETYNSDDYYAVSKNPLGPHITDPYSYTLSNGEDVWLITIINPILDRHGKFIGVSNCDVLLDTVNNLSYDLNNYKTAYSYILT